MGKRFPEIDKEQFNQNLPIELIEIVRSRADKRGWSIARTTTYYLSLGMKIDPAIFGIETERQTA